MLRFPVLWHSGRTHGLNSATPGIPNSKDVVTRSGTCRPILRNALPGPAIDRRNNNGGVWLLRRLSICERTERPGHNKQNCRTNEGLPHRQLLPNPSRILLIRFVFHKSLCGPEISGISASAGRSLGIDGFLKRRFPHTWLF
jgi:hypothetical protein